MLLKDRRSGTDTPYLIRLRMTKRSVVVYCPVIRLTRREQVFILALFFAIFIGAVVKHFRESGLRIPPPLESTE
jgi:hypothetical protein